MFQIVNNFVFPMVKTAQNLITRQYCDCDVKHAYPIIALNDIKRFVADCFCNTDVSESNSEILAEAIVQADYRGIYSEGVSRLGQYIHEIQCRNCDPKAEPTVEQEFSSVAVVNGNNGLGPITGRFCMDIAMEKALGNGIAMVAAKGSNHFGMASLYTIQAAKKGYIGLSFSNGIPHLVPPGGIEVALGMNPLSVAAPAHGESLVVDMSTSAVTLAKIKSFEQKRNELPKGWALNKKGQTEQDPDKAMIFKKLCPLGGEQSQKGFGLALLVEVLSGVIADSNCGRKIPNTTGKCKREPLNLGHGFIAINPEKFVPNFATRLSKLLNDLRNMDTLDHKKPIMIPGDRERMHMKTVDSEGGVRYSKAQLDVLEALSKALNVPFLEISISPAHSQQKKKKS